MPSFTHDSLFRSPAIEVKGLQCRHPADHAGFDHEYEASRISLVRAGVFGRMIRGAPLLADSTQVLFVNRGDIHRFVHPLEGGDSCTVLEPSPATLSELQWQFETSARRFPIDQTYVPGRVARRHYALLHLLEHRSDTDDLAPEELSLDLCGDLVSLAYEHRPARRTTLRAGAERKQRRMAENVRLVLNARLRRPPGLTELAAMVHCSAFHLSRVFRRHVGMPMRSYVARLRAARAAHRVIEGADDFALLAVELGYYDHSHLTNAFVAAWGVPPSTFRARWRTAAGFREQLFPNDPVRN